MMAARRRYSAVEHLAYAAWVNPDWGRVHMAMFTFYGDASGKKELDALVVTGFVSTAERWIEFEKAWDPHLREFGIEPPFHMTDYMGGHGQYESWSEDKERRRQFMERSVWLIKRWTNISFSSGISVVDYRRVCDTYPLMATRHPFTLCGLAVVDSVRRWLEKKYPGEPCHFVFEYGDEGYGALRNAMGYLGFPDPTREWKKNCPALTPADILGWVHGKLYREIAADKFESARPLLEAVLKQFPREPNGWDFFAYDGLMAFLQSIGEQTHEDIERMFDDPA